MQFNCHHSVRQSPRPSRYAFTERGSSLAQLIVKIVSLVIVSDFIRCALEDVYRNRGGQNGCHTNDHMRSSSARKSCFEPQDSSRSTITMSYVGDINYISTGVGWLYLATVLDLYARNVAG